MHNSVCITSFCDAIPLKPYATNDLSLGIRIFSKKTALEKRYIQPSHSYYQNSLIFDIDRTASVADLVYSMHGVPFPNFITENPENGHSHFVYLLKEPIYKTAASRLKPIQYGAAVQRALSSLLDADICYSGFMTKNPINENWRLHTLKKTPYTLGDLASFLELDQKTIKHIPPLDEAAGLGRNCYLFHNVRLWAYVEIRKFRGNTYSAWLNCVTAYCTEKNAEFLAPLPYSEVKSVAKSIARFCWKNDSYCYSEFIDRQTRKGKLGAEAAKKVGAQSKGGKAKSDQYNFKRLKAIQLRSKGMSYARIGLELGITKATIIKWCKTV